jgi:hypothetical protein
MRSPLAVHRLTHDTSRSVSGRSLVQMLQRYKNPVAHIHDTQDHHLLLG